MKLACYLSLTFLILVSGLVSNTAPFIQSSSSASTGKLAGLILDIGEARVPKAKVIVEAKGFRRETVSADDGSYQIELPEGKYKVSVIRDDFYPFSKECVRIMPSVTTQLDVTLKGRRVDGDHPLDYLRAKQPGRTGPSKSTKPNKRLERTRHERASLLSNFREPLKRSVMFLPV